MSWINAAENDMCCFSDPPVLRWLTEHQDQLNSSNPCSSRSEPAYTHGCTGWAPLLGSRSCSGRCCLSGVSVGRAEGTPGYSSWKERHPKGNGHQCCSGCDWRRKEGEIRQWKLYKRLSKSQRRVSGGMERTGGAWILERWCRENLKRLNSLTFSSKQTYQ